MEPAARQQRLRAFEEACRERGVPQTLQRRLILEAVLDGPGHPTADDVFLAVSRHHGEISRTTVYRSLETLVELGAITRACHPGHAVRYDARTEPHHHLVCMSCHELLDVSDPRLDALPVPDTSAHGFEVQDVRVQLRGTCRRCRHKEDPP